MGEFVNFKHVPINQLHLHKRYQGLNSRDQIIIKIYGGKVGHLFGFLTVPDLCVSGHIRRVTSKLRSTESDYVRQKLVRFAKFAERGSLQLYALSISQSHSLSGQT
jgi:hypothetical protein